MKAARPNADTLKADTLKSIRVEQGAEQLPGCLPAGFDVNSYLTPDQAAVWMGLSKRQLLEGTRGRNPKIPAFPIGQKTIRLHAGTVIVKLARDAGVRFDDIVSALRGGVKEAA